MTPTEEKAMPDNPDEQIALAVSPDKTGWPWKECYDCSGGRVGQDPVVVQDWAKDCQPCHGTGRVPVDLADDAYTLKLVEWMAKEGMWWDVVDESVITVAIEDLCCGECTAAKAAVRIRDLIATALKETPA